MNRDFNSIIAQYLSKGKMSADIHVDSELLQELMDQKVFALAADYISGYSLDEALRKTWMNLIFKQVFAFGIYMEEQDKLTQALLAEGITPVIIKGTASAMYYQRPEYRCFGDIDFFIHPDTTENIHRAVEIIEGIGYQQEKTSDKHLTYNNGTVRIELHSSFSTHNNSSKGDDFFDEYLEAALPVSRQLKGKTFYSYDDITNGLIFLEHIDNHLVYGLGFRQIIDWLAYADAMLYGDSEIRDEYFELADRCGLKTLMLHVQRLGEMFFGVPEQEWSKTADDKVCTNLYESLFFFGNFGSKVDRTRMSRATVMTLGRHAIKGLQKVGEKKLVKAAEAAAEESGDTQTATATGHAEVSDAKRRFAWFFLFISYLRRFLFKSPEEWKLLRDSYKDSKRNKANLKGLKAGKYRK